MGIAKLRSLPVPWACLTAASLVGLALCPVFLGFEPVGDDPDLMYRPLKAELARALKRGTLPFWSDRFGLGTPLVAESHVAALYPPNWVLYGLLEARVAYRWSMWLHYVALALAVYLLARSHRISPWGAALAAVSFALCGFTSAHACHEPFYCVLPYVPLALWAARQYLMTGKSLWQACLALFLGLQMTVGHFQTQVWTAGLVLLLGLCSIRPRGGGWGRFFGLALAVGCAAAVACPQLILTYELVRESGFRRAQSVLASFALPIDQVAQPFLPWLFARTESFSASTYWSARETSLSEAYWYIGTLPLIFAAIGFVAPSRGRDLRLWKAIIPVALLVACLPILWPGAYDLFLGIPILGRFKASARYTMISSLGLCLLAGAGLDEPRTSRRSIAGVRLACVLAAVALAWGLSWTQRPDVRSGLFQSEAVIRLVASTVLWLMSLALIACWRKGWCGPAALVLFAAAELILLFHQGPTRWGWAIEHPEQQSPILRELGRDKRGLVAGIELYNLPAALDIPPAVPYLGIDLPQANKLLWVLGTREPISDPVLALWAKRLGVSHGVYPEWAPLSPYVSTVLLTSDPVLDRLRLDIKGGPRGERRWRLVRYADPYPSAHIALSARTAWTTNKLMTELGTSDRADVVWYLAGETPKRVPGPWASHARVGPFDGEKAVVEHDGTCDLVVRRTYYPGWVARVNDGPEIPVARADGGLQSVRLYGRGPSRVQFSYHPTHFPLASSVSLLACGLALGLIARAGWLALRERRIGAAPPCGPGAYPSGYGVEPAS